MGLQRGHCSLLQKCTGGQGTQLDIRAGEQAKKGMPFQVTHPGESVVASPDTPAPSTLLSPGSHIHRRAQLRRSRVSCQKQGCSFNQSSHQPCGQGQGRSWMSLLSSLGLGLPPMGEQVAASLPTFPGRAWPCHKLKSRPHWPLSAFIWGLQMLQTQLVQY